MYISSIHIKNIRCFKALDISFDLRGQTPPWAVIVGDNAAGKTCLLKSIAIGLCDESSAAGLLRESEEGFIRRGAEKKGARIVIHLRDKQNPKRKYEIATDINKVKAGMAGGEKSSFEKVRQETTPKRSFPWGKIFACAYGAGRGTSGSGDIAGYTTISSVYNMFNYGEGLQNPELVIRRMEMKGKFPHERAFEILQGLMPNVKRFNMQTEGITASGQWGNQMPVRDLADGYKSTFVWVSDMIGWALSYNPRIRTGRGITGIALVDEIEQHLHPKWQRTIVSSLKKQFPNIQFIVTTHSPLVASNVGELFEVTKRDRLLHLSLQEKNEAVVDDEAESLKGLDLDQILASSVFDFQSTFHPQVELILAEASKLAAKGKNRKPSENRRYRKIKQVLKDEILKPTGKEPFVRDVQQEIYEEIRRQSRELERILSGKSND